MKRITCSFFTVILLFFIILNGYSQTILVWEKTYGGTLYEQPFGSEPTTDGGIILGGHSLSNDGDLTSNYGDYDWWVFKINAAGNIVWQKSYGGSLYDKCRYATENPDGTNLAFGSVKSNDSDVVGNHDPGSNDYWLIKLDPIGNILWKKCYGGTQEEGGRSVIRTFGGNYLVAGYNHSSDGDVTDHIGGYDVWLVNVEPDSGNIIWAKSYGGSKEERVRSIYQWPNGDFVFTGNSASTDYQLTGTINNGDEDVYAARIDSLGNVIWSVQYGGPGQDRAYYCTRDVDGNVLIAGKDSADGGNVTGNHGLSDVWVLKLDYNNGALIWQKSFGGTNDDQGFRIDPTADGGYIIGATTESVDGDSPGIRGLSDYWFIKVDSNLNIQWTRTDGGGSWDHLNDLVINNDGSYTGIGFSSSDPGPNSEITFNHGGFDEWLVKIAYCDSFASIIPGGSVTICSNESVTLNAPLAESYLWSTGATTQNIQVSVAGIYTVLITRANGSCVRSSLPTTVIVNTVVQPVIVTSNDSILCLTLANSYQWFYNGLALPGETNSFLLNATSCGNYYVQTTDINGCPAFSDSLFCPLSINESSGLLSKVDLFPNPVNEKIFLSVSSRRTEAVEINIFSIGGKVISRENIKLKAGLNSYLLNLAKVPKGMYILKIKQHSIIYAAKKFIKD